MMQEDLWTCSHHLWTKQWEEGRKGNQRETSLENPELPNNIPIYKYVADCYIATPVCEGRKKGNAVCNQEDSVTGCGDKRGGA